ncbi:hypothetical protein [Streptococcus equi]|uniref:hypothetical protein n=1 Tax=Streptococcus equi TaxID=1336 RepID=UPI001E3056B1|nr:hypothetical protein [Streptococcus equi]MCD3524991.1 hypothetical protein [Streptococcus equi subsp. equi]
MVRQFEFKKTVEEIEIAGEIYLLPLDDDNLLRIQRDFISYGKEIEELQKVEVEKGDPDDLADNHKQQLLVMKKVIESPFGEGSFEKLYEASGHSLMNMVDLLDYLVELVAEKLSKIRLVPLKQKRSITPRSARKSR